MRLLVVTLALLAVGVAAAEAASAPLVPTVVQGRIKHSAPRLAYTPTRIAPGFRYSTWRAELDTLRIWFKNKAGWQIVFVAAPLRGDCRAGMEKSFQLAGNKVYWSHTDSEQQAWRCVPGPANQPVRLVAASPEPPTKFADVGLGVVAASGKLIP
jgi:hypothetical protein